MAGTYHLGILPCSTIPAGIPIDVRRLGIINMRIGNDRMLILVQRYLPYPVTHIGTFINNRSGIIAGIGIGLIHIEHTVINDTQLLAFQVAQDGAVAIINVNDVEVKPVGHLVIRMPSGVAHVDLILAVACILGIGARTR